MRRPSTKCDIEITPTLRRAFEVGKLEPVCFYWTINREVVLTMVGRSDAVVAATPLQAILDAVQYRGL